MQGERRTLLSEHSEMMDDETIVISRDALSALMINNDTYTPRTVVLQRGKKGFGFVLRGCRGRRPTPRHSLSLISTRLFSLVVGTLFHPTPSFPALQFLDTIEKGSNADRAGLKQNDYVLEVTHLFLFFFFFEDERVNCVSDQRHECHFHSSRRMCSTDQTSWRYSRLESGHCSTVVESHFSLVTLSTQR